MATPKRIGLLTGGGDCPGLNAVIRAVTKGALNCGIEVVGIQDGFQGLLENRTQPLGYEDVSNILTTGGTILGSSNRANPRQFLVGKDEDGQPIYEDRREQCVDVLREHRIDALVVVGGDGTLTIGHDFVELEIPSVGVPKTIDNDIHGTDITFGFLSATAVATDALDRVHTTAASHHRALIVEVMGRNAGWIALHAGVASGSDVILIPEIPFSPHRVCEVIERRAKVGKRFTVLCVSEGAAPIGGEQVVQRHVADPAEPKRLGGVSSVVAETIEERTGVAARYVVLGHVQRGGSPIAADRVLATQFGHGAVELLKAGQLNRMIAMQEGRLTSIDITEPAGKQRLVPPDQPLIAAARGVYTSFGD